jgi:hypothetical protein
LVFVSTMNIMPSAVVLTKSQHFWLKGANTPNNWGANKSITA